MDFIEQYEEIKQVTRFHNINRSGVPKGITRVPTLVKFDGTALIGGDIKDYFESIMVPNTHGFEKSGGTSLEGKDDDSMFSLNNYGSSLAPKMTKELEQRIAADVKSSFKSYEPVNTK
jgi:hypothetical protein